jgi:hypothetical protein
MANLLPLFVPGDQFDIDKANAIVIAINNRAERVTKKAISFPLGITSGSPVAHGIGTALGLAMSDYDILVTALDAEGNAVSGIKASKTSADVVTLTFDNTTITFYGTLFFDVYPKV